MPKVTKIEPTIDNSPLNKMRCAAYCRVSSGSEDQLHSYAAQVKYYTEMLGGSKDKILADIYADEGITGTCQDKRTEFVRMMKDCRKGKIDRIYTKSISRFSRNTKDCLKSIRELKELGISVLFEKENIDTANIPDEMMITIMGGLAQEESTSISQNMRWSIQKRMENGTMKLCTPLFGYKLVEGRLIVDHDEAAIVKRIFNWYLNGYGSHKIADMLNDAGIKHKGISGNWTGYSIRIILKNEKYIGDQIHQKKYTTTALPHKNLPNRGEMPKYYYSKSHEPIITDDNYYKAQEIMKMRHEKTCSQKENTKSILSGKIECGHCKKKYRYRKTGDNCCWVCRNHNLKAELCASKPILENDIRQAFVRLCNKLILNYKEILLSMQRLLRELNSKRFSSNTRVYEIRKQIAELKDQKHVISRLRTKGFIDEQKFGKQNVTLDNKLSRLNMELNKISKADSDDEALEQLDMLIEAFESRNEIFAEFDENMFNQIVEKIIVKDNILEFELISGLKLREKIYSN